MFRQKSVIFLALAAVMAIAIACSSATPTPVPPTSTSVPTATPVPTSTPVPAPIVIDPAADPVGFFESLPGDEATCAADALGGRDRVFGMLEGSLGDAKLTQSEADALDACLSDDTVEAVFVGQLAREADGLSDATIVCIGEQIGGLSAASLFVDDPAADAAISVLKGLFCLNGDEREAIAASDAFYGFGELGGIDALECVVDGVGSTGLQDLMGLASAGGMDFATMGDLFPLLIECSAVEDSIFDELGVTGDQVGCLFSELGEDGLALLDPTAAEPDFSELAALLGTLSECGISMEELLETATLQVDPDAMTDLVELPTVVIELPEDIADIDLPFTEEQIICLTEAIGEEEIANLLEGGAPNLALFTALATCEVDIATLLGG